MLNDVIDFAGGAVSLTILGYFGYRLVMQLAIIAGA